MLSLWQFCHCPIPIAAAKAQLDGGDQIRADGFANVSEFTGDRQIKCHLDTAARGIPLEATDRGRVALTDRHQIVACIICRQTYFCFLSWLDKANIFWINEK